MHSLLSLSRGIDRLSQAAAILASVLCFVSCFISAANALSRYLFDASSNAWLEIQWQMFAGTFLLGAAWVLKLNEHVRVDLVYGSLSTRSKAKVDIFGFLFFFFPFCLVMLDMTVPWFLRSFWSGEGSANAGGLPVWPVKGLLPVGFALLLLQGMSELVKRVALLRGTGEVALAYERPLQ
ncbi:MAG: TRAP transporter small permease subunit [Aestuariivirga sp.]|uniref:TRAP transporter small permease subunit n=1 Tax=Aestuariivirga sp. TaxID=2650926 RepID=UPI0025B7DC22|nr:TRAP transporter small permease subunit [Aestuariivirga sp.]MCA3560983.1 TRAP transporter small permease subunit [Aestuariivirga sp.]